jgi:hypothetical protein
MIIYKWPLVVLVALAVVRRERVVGGAGIKRA